MMQLQKQQEEPTQKAWNISLEKYPIGFVQFLQLPIINDDIINDEPHSFFYNNHYQFLHYTAFFRPPNLI